MMAPPLVLVALVALPLVDPGVRELPRCPRNAISFRTATEGWVTSSCGVFRTRDGGLGWERHTAIEKHFMSGVDPSWSTEHLGFMRWFTPNGAIAGGSIGARVLRTADGGKAWPQVPLPGDQAI